MSPASSTRVRQAFELLQMIGIPREQQNERSALTLLALADIKPRKPWKRATAPLRRITEMMDWMRDQYEVRYAPNTREPSAAKRFTNLSNTAYSSKIPISPSARSTAPSGAISSPRLH